MYHREILCDAPVVSDYQAEGKQITIRFFNAEGGLMLMGETVQALEILASEKKLAFETEILDDKLIISIKEEITGSFEVCFAKEKFYTVNLYNRAGIPAVPFSFVIEREEK